MISDEKQRTTLFLNPAIAKHAKAQAILEDLSLTVLVERVLIQYLPKETIIKRPEVEVLILKLKPSKSGTADS